MINTYMLCATPRSGSTLLCEYLLSSRIAGKPASYFRAQGMLSYAEEWQVLQPDGAYNFRDYLEATRRAGRSANGVLGLRVMWGSLAELTEELALLYPELAGNDLALLEHAFGQVKFVYLRRDDVVGQAISLLRAERTNYWHSTEGPLPQDIPKYDFEEIAARVELLHSHNLAWQAWFTRVGVAPCLLRYEDLEADPPGCTEKVLHFLGLGLPQGARLTAPNQRLADPTTAAWKLRYDEDLENSKNAERMR